jgi:hypothetical protein
MTALDLTTAETSPDETTAPVVTGEASSDARQNLIDYASLGGFTLTSETHAWYAAVDAVGTPEAARAASTVLTELRGRDLPATREAAISLAENTTLGELDSVVAVGRALALTLRVRATLEVLLPAAYESDQLDTLAAATGSGRWRKEQDAKLTFSQRLNLGRVARGLAVAKRPRRSTLHTALVSAVAERADWVAISPTGDQPALPSDLGFLDVSVQAVDTACEALAELGRLEVHSNPAALSLDELGQLVDRLAADEGTLHRLPALHTLRESLREQGYAELVAELTAARADTEAVAEAVNREFGAAEAEAPAEESSAQALVPSPREEDSTVPEAATAGVEADVEPEAEVAPAVEVAPEAEIVSVEPEPEAEPEAVVVEPATVEVAVEVPEAVVEVEPEVSEPVAVEAAVVEAVSVPEVAAEVAAPVPDVEEPLAPRRPRKPAVTAGRPVTAYSAEELVSVVRWIDSDGVKRTDDELLRAAMKELGFARLGPRIKDSLGGAIATVRS